SVLNTTTHLGAHADGPLHTEPHGEAIGRRPLEPYLGPCQVVHVPGVRLIEPRHLETTDLGHPPRLLLRTDSARERGGFRERFAARPLQTAELIAAHRTLLVGLDTPSVDPFDSKSLEAHHALARGGVAILEGLLLDGVPAGIYELIALPLRLLDADASPVRAVL